MYASSRRAGGSEALPAWLEQQAGHCTAGHVVATPVPRFCIHFGTTACTAFGALPLSYACLLAFCALLTATARPLHFPNAVKISVC